MNTPPLEERIDSRLSRAHGAALCLLTAVLAEVILDRSIGGLLRVDPIAHGRILLVFMLLYAVHHFAVQSLSYYKPALKDAVYLHLVLIGTLLLVEMGDVVALGLSTYSRTVNYLGGIQHESFGFMVPYATGALLLQSVLGLHFGLVFAISLSMIIGIFRPTEMILAPYVLITALVACLSITSFRSRSAYTRAGFNIGLVALPVALASIILSGNLSVGDIVVRVSGALLSGALCSFLAAGIVPVVEYLGGYVTDLRLMEIATLDHPLLKELSVQAPGTWNHSMVMGMMAEAAAESIGANPVVARVGAYFHDIGKCKKPLYFVENQGGLGENRHDKLSTSMSALIIRSHVKDGIELSQKYNVPAIIVDMIPQHHGTALIEYFYEKACKEIEDTGGDTADVDQSLYRYPGPKPQTKEAGILMLADGIEAAARTIAEPSLDRIQGLVQKMMNKVFASGQLSECELTLNDLHSIAKCFTRVLNGIYHQRIAYAEPAEKVSQKPQDKEGASAPGPVQGPDNTPEMAGGGAAKKIRSNSENGDDKESSKENLKRLGL